MATTDPTGAIAPTIKFPALWFSQNLVDMIDSLNGVTECTKLAFKSGFYKQLLLVDSDSNAFRVVGAKKVKTLIKPRFGLLLELIAGNPLWQVQLIFEANPSVMALADIKALIFESFKREKYLWEERADFEEFHEKLVASRSITEIFDTFRGFSPPATAAV